MPLRNDRLQFLLSTLAINPRGESTISGSWRKVDIQKPRILCLEREDMLVSISKSCSLFVHEDTLG